MSDDKTASAVALKLPTFWANNPKLWFCSVEAQFAIRNIVADETKFHYVVAALTDDMANAVADVITKPPTNDKYSTIKNSLTRFYQIPPVKKVLKFIQIGADITNLASFILARLLNFHKLTQP